MGLLRVAGKTNPVGRITGNRWWGSLEFMQLFSRLSPSSGGGSSWLWRVGYGVQSPWCVEAGWPQQVARNGWFALWSILEDGEHVCAFSVQTTGLTRGWDILGCITKGVITLLKKGSKHIWEEVDNYRPITLLNTALKILAWVLVNHLHLVISDLIGPEQNYTVKGRSIQDNLHLVCKVPEGLEDDTVVELISLAQSKATNMVDYPSVFGNSFGDNQIQTRVLQMD